MKKKVLYGVFMALFAFAAIGTLQSCKDDVSDLRVQTEYDVANLKNQLSDVAGKLKGAIDANTTAIGNNTTAIGNNATAIANNAKEIANIKRDYATVSWILQVLGEENLDAVTRDIIDKGGLMGIINGALTDISNNTKEITNIKNALGKADGSDPATIYGRLKALEASSNAVMAGFGATDAASLQAKIAKLMDDIYNAESGALAKIAELEDDVADLAAEFNEFINTNVSGVLIQGTDNPIFGNFSLPIGVRSNMLFNWYGENWRTFDIDFPSAEDAFDVAQSAINSAALNKIGAPVNEPFTVKQGAYYGNGKDGISLGKVYLTINPVGVDFSNGFFNIETSAGEEGRLPYGFNVVPSNDELAFGFINSTRSVENGFYEADVVMSTNENDIKKTDIGLTQTLEAAMEDVVNGGSKKTAGIDILKKLYNLMSGDLKAYGVRYDWTFNNNGESVSRSILSQYDLAVATAQPIGFNFLKGKGTSRKLPTFGSVDNFLNRLNDKINGKFSFKSKNITIKGKSVAFVGDDDNLTVEKNPNYNPSQIEDPNNPGHTIANPNSPCDDNKLIITIKGLQVAGTSVGTLVTKAADADNVIKAVNDKLVEAIYVALNPSDVNDAGAPKYTDEVLQGQIVAQCDVMLLEMQKEVNSAIDDITARATSTVDNAINKVRNHSERLQKLVDLYNKVANKIGDVLATPNDYLQVAAFYKSGNGFGILSSDPASPTQMTSGNGLHLFLSTYTAELIAPACKKYIAVTAVNGDSGKIDGLNNGGDLNTVLDGTVIDAVVPVDGWKAGNVYTITYQALDYRGYTSTRKFYIQVI